MAYVQNNDEFSHVDIDGDDGVEASAALPEKDANLDAFAIVRVILVLCALAFSGLILYMLLSGNIKAVQEACGGLWGLLLSRVVVSILVGIILMADSLFSEWNCIVFVLRGQHGAMFFLVYFLAFSIAEISVIPNAMIGNDLCTNTLSNNSPTGTPLLGILGWINLGIDWCFVVLMSVALLMTRNQHRHAGQHQ